jgi:DNA-binding beta-propeller fold protein YncE
MLMTDSGRGVVYRTRDDHLEVWLDEGLERPTGIAVSASGDRVWIADTGVHQLVVFDAEGREVDRIGNRNESDLGLNYPTFLAPAADGGVIVNDTLNYRIKLYSLSGDLRLAFGEEGAAPGQFARAKGVAQAPDGRVLVVDGMLDRVQVFDASGVPVGQFGSQGEAEGMFWSPAGIDIVGDLVYVADTYNHRIQVLRLESQEEAP